MHGRRRLAVAERLFEAALLAFPRTFRERHRNGMSEAFLERHRPSRDLHPSRWALSVMVTLADLIVQGLVERLASLARPSLAPGGDGGSRGLRSAPFLAVAAGTGDAWAAALRGMVRRPRFLVVGVTVVSVGVGATTSVYSVADHLLYRPLPGVTGSDELVGIVIGRDAGRATTMMSNPRAERVMAVGDLYRSVAARASLEADVTVGEGSASRVAAEIVSPSYFATLGVSPATGRLFDGREGDPDAVHAVTVISHGFWSSRFARDPGVLGTTLRINGADFEIVGVAAESFQGSNRTESIELWVPTAAAPAVLSRLPANVLRLEGVPIWHEILVRPAEGVTASDVEGRVRQVLADEEMGDFEPVVYSGVGTSPGLRWRLGSVAGILWALVAALLTLTAVNFTTIVLSRISFKTPEVRLRKALGATPGRLSGELASELLILSVLASGGAVVVATGGLGFLRGSQLVSWLPPLDHVPLNGRVMAFALTAAVGMAMAAAIFGRFGLPGLAGLASLAATARSGRRQSRLRRSLVSAQLGVSLALVVTALLLWQSLANLQRADSGLDGEGVMVFSLNPGVQGLTATESDELFRTLLTRLQGSPRVRSAAFAWLEPGGRRRYVERVSSPVLSEPVSVDANMVTPDFFSTLGIDVLDGRPFDDTEFQRLARPQRGAVVVNETLADILFPDGAVGRELTMPGRREEAFEVVGVVADASLVTFGAPAEATLFDPFGNGYRTTSASFVVRTMEPERAVSGMRAIVEEVAPGIPILRAQALDDRIRGAFAEERTLFRISGVFAGLALVLAVFGLYGLVSEHSLRRARELGIRRALGASRPSLAGTVFSDLAPMFVGGVGVGAILLAMGSGSLRTHLVDVQILDPSLAVAALVILLLAVAAGAGTPALTASRIEPLEALHED